MYKANINNLFNIADFALDYQLLLFEQMLDRQMVELKQGPNYVNNFMDALIAELSTDRIIGRHEEH